MIEVQCPSCQTRYRIDESVLPQDSPTFKCSRCGHVFNSDPRLARKPPIPKPKPAPAPAAKPPPPRQSAPEPPLPPPAQPAIPQRTGVSAELPFEESEPPVASSSSAGLQTPRSAPPPQTGDSAASRNPEQAQTPPRAAATIPRQDYALAPPPPPPSPLRPRPASAAAARSARPPSAAEHDNPLARSFADEEPRTAENLSFDFSEAEEQHQQGEANEPEDRYERWQVGDPDTEPVQEPPLTPEMSRYQARRAAIAQANRGMEKPSPAPQTEERERVRSSSFFLGLMALIVIGFAFLTFILGFSTSFSRELLSQLPVIGGEFTAAAPPRQSPISLSDVHAEYRVLDSHRRALIVSGVAENHGDAPLHTIQLGVSLVDGDQRPVLSQAVFCGELVSPKIVSQMTPHELQFFQKLAPPKNFLLKSGDSTPFFVMFINPPPIVANFQVSILKAEPADDAASATGI